MTTTKTSGRARSVALSAAAGKVFVKLTIGTADTTDMSVVPNQFGMLSQLLDAAELRHRVISQNVANVNTPNYKRLDVSFEDQLAERLSNPMGGDTSGLSPQIQTDDSAHVRADGNSVDIDREMGQLNKNALLYQTYAQVLASKMAMMRSAITGQ